MVGVGTGDRVRVVVAVGVAVTVIVSVGVEAGSGLVVPFDQSKLLSQFVDAFGDLPILLSAAGVPTTPPVP